MEVANADPFATGSALTTSMQDCRIRGVKEFNIFGAEIQKARKIK